MPRGSTNAMTPDELEAAAERLERAIADEAADPYVACELCCRLLCRFVSRCIGKPVVTARLDPDAWLTAREAATALGVSHRYLNELLHEGRIASVTIGHVGKHRRVKGSDIIRFLDERRSPSRRNGEETDEA